MIHRLELGWAAVFLTKFQGIVHPKQNLIRGQWVTLKPRGFFFLRNRKKEGGGIFARQNIPEIGNLDRVVRWGWHSRGHTP